jgi:serine/threonine-protein kinase
MSGLLGRTIGEYRLVEFLGAGGMGEVYRGEHAKIGRVVAIKVLSRGETQTGAAARFLNEARIQAGVHHPHIAALYDFVEGVGRPCIIMEYVDGELLERRVERSKGLLLGDAVRWFGQIVEAIAHLHKLGIVHRDIKSSNIKIDRTGAIKLLDFGIARDRRSGKVTTAGVYVGTPYYSAPELFSGAKADSQSDVWALGVLLYEMLCGRMPYVADSIAELSRAVARPSYDRPSKLNPSCTPAAERIIDRCLQREPGARYGSAGELLDAIQRLDAADIRYTWRDRIRIRTWTPAARAYWPLLGVASLGVALVIWLAWPSAGPPERLVPPPAVKPSLEDTGDASKRVVSIMSTVPDTSEIVAEGRIIGHTPYQARLPLGRSYAWTLRAEGYEDAQLEFIVRETENAYSFVLKKKDLKK